MDEPRHRRRRRREVLRASLELGSFAVFAIVVLVALGIVLDVGQGRSAPPPGTLVISQSSDFASIGLSQIVPVFGRTRAHLPSTLQVTAPSSVPLTAMATSTFDPRAPAP